MHVIGICGSLRKGSLNMLALKAAQGLLPAGSTMEIADLRPIPLYDEDLRTGGDPEAVATLKAKIRQADAVLIASPEYNFAYSGVLKNALDWFSRPPEPAFDGKPVAIFGASPGAIGTARGQYQLRQVLNGMNAFVLNRPEVFIGGAQAKFGPDGALTDADTAKFITLQLEALQALVNRVALKG